MFKFYVGFTLFYCLISILLFFYSLSCTKGKMKFLQKTYEVTSTIVLIVGIVLLLCQKETWLYSILISTFACVALIFKKIFREKEDEIKQKKGAKDYVMIKFIYVISEALICQAVSVILLMNTILKFMTH